MDFLKDLSIDKVRNLAEDAYNQAKPKTDVEARVYEVLSHKNWGASSTIMNEVARDTFDYDRFSLISQLMWESMEGQRPAAWRVVFKGLTLLEHLIKNGSERCVDDARNHGHILRSLLQFNYYEGTIDRGQGVREKTKQILDILGDDERIREERQKSRKLREKFGGNLGGVSGGGGSGGGGGGGGGGGRYSGYGNDNWDSRGDSGGYGDGGIDNKASSSGGYGGRYDQDDTRGTAEASSAPTFATIPNEPIKTKKKKKKKSVVSEPAPAPAPEVDLFEFGAPAPAPTGDDSFGDFAGSSGGPINDPFASPAPVASFDAFGSAPVAPAPVVQAPNTQFDPFASGGMNPVGGAAVAPMNGMPGNMMSGPMGGASVQPAPAAIVDDDFGDFAGASNATPSLPTPASAAATKSSDPLAGLISLDGLTKNKKNDDNLSKPVIGNTVMSSSQPVNNNNMMPSNTLGTGTFGGASAIDAMDPAALMSSNATAQKQQGMGNMMSPGGMAGMQSGAGGMGNMQVNGGMGNMQPNGGMGNMQPNGGMGNMQPNGGMGGMQPNGGMGNMQANGGMGNMQGGTPMNPQQQQQMMMQMMQQGGMQMTPQQQQMMMQMMQMQQQQQGGSNTMGAGF